ncbi:MAG TPA: M56 family metallopeptidase, partial [Planctomycetaceae bacterium]|nr:M56 family metallopeptidase [Planctomycetaceae bacterium]
MNRALFILISVSSVSSLLLIDSAIKGTALLLFAGVVVLFLRRDSAATRHLVWLVAIIAMLAVPLLSAMLPQWRVLPEWANVVDFAEENRNESNGKNGIYDAGLPIHDSHASYDSHDFGAANTLPIDNDLLSPPTEDIHAASNIEPPVTAEIFAAVPTAKATIWTWHHAIASLWFFGFLILIIRLTIARAMLWRTECRSCQSRRHSPSDEVIGPAQANRTATRTSAGDAGTEFHHSESDVYSAFTAACTTLNIRQHVTLLLHPDKTIPVVWGIFRPRLMLPLAAQSWSDEQLRSVLLHELAHIKRRDVLGQLLAQFACALHWFNPLVWFAAWRLHVERERACDDLVLTSGVRASAYAEHLLNVATRLSSSPWTQTCGLAMARNSSLHGRLTAVLSEKQNRRSVTSTSIGVSLLFSVCVAIPIAMLHTASAQPAIAQSKQHIAVWRSDPVAAIVAAWEARQNTFRFAEFNAVEMRVCMPGANVPAALLPGDEIKWGPDFDRTIG